MDFQRFSRFSGALVGLSIGLLASIPGQAGLPNFGVVPIQPAKPAPAFTLPDLSSHTVRLEDFKGKVVILNFWASWCGPCVEELPALGKLYERYKDKDWVLIGVSVDSSKSAVQKAVTRHHIPFLVLHDEESKVAPRFGARALPTTYFINRSGEVTGMLQGGRDWDSDAARAWMDDLLTPSKESGKPAAKAPEKAGSQARLAAPASPVPAGIEATMKLTPSAKRVWMGRPFSLFVDVRWKDELGQSGFESPRTTWPQGVRFLSDMTEAYREGEFNILRTEMRLQLESGPEGLQSLGPFEATYHDAQGRSGTLASSTVTVTALSLTKRLRKPALVLFLTFAAGVFGYLVYRARKARRLTATTQRTNAQSADDRIAQIHHLGQSGDVENFYEKLLEVSQVDPGNPFVKHLRSRLDAVRYGGYRPGPAEIEEDFRRAKDSMNH